MSDVILLDMEYWQRNGNKVIANIYNVQLALLNKEVCRFMAKYDNKSESIIFLDTGMGNQVTPHTEELLIQLRMRLETMFSFDPISQDIMRDAVLFVAKHNCIN